VFAGLKEARSVVRRSMSLSLVEPAAGAAWDEAYQRFLKLTAG
jgi:hypothetical protein